MPAIKGGEAPNEPGQILVLLNVGAIFMGTALTIRALIGERAIFLREQAVGLSTSAYILAKVFVFAGFALMQSAIVVGINVWREGVGPWSRDQRRGDTSSDPGVVRRHRGLLCGSGDDSAWRCRRWPRSNEQIMPLLVIAIMSQLVFQGGMIPVTGRVGARPVVVDHACAVGIRQHRVDD